MLITYGCDLVYFYCEVIKVRSQSQPGLGESHQLSWRQEIFMGGGGPGVRTLHGIAYDSVRKAVVLFGGLRPETQILGPIVPESFLNDVSYRTGEKWEERDAGPGPSPRCRASRSSPRRRRARAR